MLFKKFSLEPTCLICGKLASLEQQLCSECDQDFTPFQGGCEVCALPLENGYRCEACLSKPPYFDKVFCAFIYQGQVAHAVKALKYAGKTQLANVLVEKSKTMVWPEVTQLIPVPMGFFRRFVRRYNQATLLADALARELKRPVCLNLLRKKAFIPSQTRFGYKRRINSVYKAFQIKDNLSVEGHDLLLVDDVVTTGATVNECARLLKKQGAHKVYVWAAARALRRL